MSDIRVICIGDPLLSGDTIGEGMSDLCHSRGWKLTCLDWPLTSIEALQKINLEVETRGPGGIDVPDGFPDQIASADILVVHFFPVNKAVFKLCPSLKLIGVLRGGSENIDKEYARKNHIPVLNTPGRNADAVADFAVAMMLCEVRNIARGHMALKQGLWRKDFPNSSYIPDFPGKIIGLVGFGNIGRKVAKRLGGFGVKVLVYDPFADAIPDWIRSVSLEELLEKSDIVSLHSRLTDENHHLINEMRFNQMKEGAYLVNTARSGLVDEKALYKALSSGHLAGAALDVFDREPPDRTSPLLTLDNITLCPHLAGSTTDAFIKSPVKLAEKLDRYWTENMNKPEARDES